MDSVTPPGFERVFKERIEEKHDTNYKRRKKKGVKC